MTHLQARPAHARATRIARRPLARALGALLACALVPAALSAQAQTAEWDFGGLEMSRLKLDSLLKNYQDVAASTVYGDRIRAQAQTAADQIQDRLQQGDFRAGDRIVLQIAGETRAADTVIVQPGGEIALVGMGRISLAGVLRSELQEHLQKELGRFIRTPSVRTISLIRLSIQGAVGRPGFYVVPATALLDDVIMQSGGPGPSADLDKVVIQREGQTLLTGEDVRQAIAQGRSMDQLNLRAGDQIVVPNRTISNTWKVIGRYAVFILAPLLLGVRLL